MSYVLPFSFNSRVAIAPGDESDMRTWHATSSAGSFQSTVLSAFFNGSMSFPCENKSIVNLGMPLVVISRCSVERN